MPLVFPVLLLLILGAVTLASRSTSSYLAASKQSDAQAARQAAESGMNRVLRALNPYGKNAADPYLSFLLLSNWDQSAKNWPISKLGQAAIRARLVRCRISTRGMRESQVLPSTSQPYDRLVSDVVGTTGNGKRTLRYTIVDYVPPLSAAGLPSECSDFFSTLTGGSAQITIEGTVDIDGKQLASQRLTRTIDVDPVPFPDLPDNMPVPGSPIGLRITNAGVGLGEMRSMVYANFAEDANTQELGNTFGNLRPQCLNCSPALLNGVTKTPPPDDLRELPPPPVDSTFKLPLVLSGFLNKSPKSLTLSSNPLTVTKIDASSVANKVNFNCEFTQNNTEISCYINDITVGPPSDLVSPYTPPVGRLQVDTSQYPVTLYIDGDVGGAPGNPGAPIPPPDSEAPKVPPAPPSTPLDDGKVAIEHCVKTCSTSPVFYDHNNLSLRPAWGRLRIIGSFNPLASQAFYIAAKSPAVPPITSLHGVFMWLPQGKLLLGNPTYTYDSLNMKWLKTSVEAAPSPLLATWWLENLDFTNLTGAMDFIMPLYGNPEAMSAVLQGGYFNLAGQFTPDSRFPVYPVLPRIRSSF
ncbi:MAG: hypothetical protein ACK6CO_03960 [Cyanobacteriota bacterium]